MTDYIPSAEGAAERILKAAGLDGMAPNREMILLMMRIAYIDGQCDLLREQRDRARDERANG